jgi:hypothetical protein
MSGDDVVRDHANHGYLRLSGDAAEGAAELARSEMEFGVLVDSVGHPQLLLTGDGRTAPAVVIDAGAPMGRVLAPDIVGLLNSGVPGLVVTDDSGITGVLSASAVIDYLVEHSPVRSGFLGDDGRLHGDAPVTPLKLTCSTCGTVNSVLFFVAGETQCSQGHPLTLAWA